MKKIILTLTLAIVASVTGASAQSFMNLVESLKAIPGVEAKEINQAFQGIPTEGGWAMLAPYEAQDAIKEVMSGIDEKHLFNTDPNGNKVYINQSADPVEVFMYAVMFQPIIPGKNIMMMVLQTSPDVLPMLKEYFNR